MTLIKLMTYFHQIFICLLFEVFYEIILLDWDQNSIKNADTADHFVRKRTSEAPYKRNNEDHFV